MFGLLKLIRVFIGGKTELGIIVFIVSVAVYTLPIATGFTLDDLKALLIAVTSLTGVALASRIEDKEGVLEALKSLFSVFRRTR